MEFVYNSFMKGDYGKVKEMKRLGRKPTRTQKTPAELNAMQKELISKRNQNLMQRMKQGDREAIHEFVKNNRMLIIFKMKKAGLYLVPHLEDILQEIELKLLTGDAIQKFDPSKSEIPSYFSACFRRVIQEYERKNANIVPRSPQSLYNYLPQARATARDLMKQGKKPTVKAIAESLISYGEQRRGKPLAELTKRKIRRGVRALAKTRLDDLSIEQTPRKKLERILLPEAQTPFTILERADFERSLDESLAMLKKAMPRSWFVVVNNLEKGMTLEEIEKQLWFRGRKKISKEGARHIKQKGINFLIKQLKKRGYY